MAATNTNSDHITMKEDLIRFFCTYCGQSISTETSSAGVETQCPTCHKAIKVPDLEPTESSRTSEASDSSHDGEPEQVTVISTFFGWVQETILGKVALFAMVFLPILGMFVLASGSIGNPFSDSNKVPKWLIGEWYFDSHETGSGLGSSLSARMALKMLEGQTIFITQREIQTDFSGERTTQSIAGVNTESDRCTIEFSNGSSQTFYRTSSGFHYNRDGGANDFHFSRERTRASSPSSSHSYRVNNEASPCGRCRGRGSMIGQCHQCFGAGSITTKNARFGDIEVQSQRITVACPRCGGTGQVPTPCARCKGSGRSAY